MNETLPKRMELLSEETEAVNIAKDWLLRKQLRGRLNPQLATMLRACLEIEAGEFKKTNNVEKFCFCPWCSADVKELPNTDAWVIAKKCQNGHEFKERGYHIGHESSFLEHEITYNFLKDCLKSYLTEQEPSKYVPNQLKPVLEIFRKKLANV